MQFQVDAGDARPTFFELVAADRLVPSLRAALVYSLGVLVQRRPSLGGARSASRVTSVAHLADG